MHGSRRSWWILIARGTHVIIIIIIIIIIIVVVIIIIIIVIVTMNINIKGALISLLKPKSEFLIWKRIFRFFTKIQKRIMDPKWSSTGVDSLDHIQNRILWMRGPKCFFCTDPKRVNIARGHFK